MLPRLLLLLCLMLAAPALAERRVALVLAAEDYRHLRKLENPVNDALAVEELLSGLGFAVTVETNRDLRRMRRALEDFRADGAGADVALLFYAGHGVEIAGQNYLLPVDAVAGSAQAVAESGLPLAEVQATLAAVSSVAIVLLDACREDPWGTGGSGQGRSAVALSEALAMPKPGLGRVGRADGVLFAFAAAPGEVAADGAGVDSPFTEALLRHFATPGVEVRTALTLVQQDVYDRSRGKQLPYIESGLPKLFFAAAVAEMGERERLLVAMAGLPPELRAEVEALAAQNDMPLAPLYGALLSANLAGKDAGARAQSLVQSAQAFLRFREQLQQLSPDDPAVAELRVRAEKALDLGAFDQARQALQQAADLDAAARDVLRDTYRARTLSQAQTHALAASAARADLRYDLAMADLTRALALYAELEGPDLARADRAAYTDLLWDQGDLFRMIGNSGMALRAYRAWEAVAFARVGEAPGDGEFLRNWSVARVNIGDMAFVQGDMAAAEAEYRAVLAVAADLAVRKDAPLKWRHDLFVVQSKLGDVAQAKGDLAAALDLQGAGQAVLRDLVAAFPDRDDVRRDLAVSLDRTGDLRRFSGDLAAAEAAYREGLALRQALFDGAPDSAAWANELATSLDKLGDLALVQADPGTALALFQRQADLQAELAEKDPGNALLQSGLALALLKLGDARVVLGDPAAVGFYERSRAIRARLAALDQANADWQRALVVIEQRLGDLAFKAQDFAAAKLRFDAALAIARKLAVAEPANAERQSDLAAALDRLGDVWMMQDDPAAAEAAVGESFRIAQALAERFPENADYQIGLITSLVRLAMFDADPRRKLQEALDRLQRLQADGRLDPAKRAWVKLLQAQIAAP